MRLSAKRRREAGRRLRQSPQVRLLVLSDFTPLELAL